MNRMVAGIDEAGRGAILGPLVIAGVAIEEKRLQELVDLGVRDSKLLSRNARQRLYRGIRRRTDLIQIVKLLPKEIDTCVLKGKKFRRLNYLEAIGFAKVISRLDSDAYYVDSPDVKPERFSKDIIELLGKKVKITASHFADSRYPIVSAASIIAKVVRDSQIHRLSKSYGPLGSGYPGDPETRKFLRNWLEREDGLPSFGRSSWKTWTRLKETRLDDFTS